MGNNDSDNLGDIWVLVLVSSDSNKKMWWHVIVHPILGVSEGRCDIAILSDEFLQRDESVRDRSSLLAEPNDLVASVSNILWGTSDAENVGSHTLLHHFDSIVKKLLPALEFLELCKLDCVTWDWVLVNSLFTVKHDETGISFLNFGLISSDSNNLISVES